MADRFFGLNRGQDGSLVTEGASTGSTNVELRVNDAVNLTKHEVERLVRKIVEHINERNDTIPSTNNV